MQPSDHNAMPHYPLHSIVPLGRRWTVYVCDHAVGAADVELWTSTNPILQGIGTLNALGGAVLLCTRKHAILRT